MRKLFALIAVLGMLTIGASYMLMAQENETTQTETTETEDDFGHYLRKERSSSAYQRTFTITDIDEESIKAVFEDGVLTLTLPKASYKDAPAKNIPIE